MKTVFKAARTSATLKGCRHLLLAIPFLTLAAAHQASAQSSANLYAGKTVQIIIGAGPGGGNDVWGRAIARYLGAHLPGTPTVIARNMPGGGSIVAANHIYNIAAKDGTEIGLITRDTAVGPISGAKGARFDATKITWIGSPTADTTICTATPQSGIRTVEDLKTKELVVGNTGAGTGSYIYPKALNGLLGLKFKSISGFPSSSDVALAIERGEVNGTCNALTSFTTLRPTWVKEGKVTIFLQVALERSPALPNVPSVLDLTKDEETRTALVFLVAPEELGRPLIAPPGLKPQIVKALRDGLSATLKDPAFLADAKAQKLDIAPISGEQLEKLIAAIYKTPKPIVEKVNALSQ